MIETVTVILLIILISRASEQITKIPTTLFLITYSYLTTILFGGFFVISKEQFGGILYLMIPIILLPDLLKISLTEVKANIFPILYLSVISVILSIALATIIIPYLLTDYSLTIAAWIALFTMLMATDAITVSSILSNFNLPSKLKIYAEGESLLNDVTALVIFYFIALPMLNGVEVSLADVSFIVFEVVLKSVVIGVGFGYLGFLSVKALKDPIEQFIIIYLVSIVAFIVAEHLHISGILSVIVAVTSFKLLIDNQLQKNPKLLFEQYERNLTSSEDKIYDIIVNMEKYIPTMTKKEFRDYKRETFFIGIFANGVVFILMAYIFDIYLLQQYLFEIIVVFILTTLIRLSSIFSMFSILKKDIHWTFSLTLSGVKGALTIIMVHSLPDTFIYKELFEAIVVGNVILSTFIYTLILVFYINKHKDDFKIDILRDSTMETDSKSSEDTIRNIKNYIEKDSITGAYNKIFIDEILDSELAKALRYKIDLSAIAFKIEELEQIESKESIDIILKDISKIVKNKIRLSDYYGQIEKNYYLIITVHTNLSGAAILAERLEKDFKEYNAQSSHNLIFEFGITASGEMESRETLFEKIEDALNSSKYTKKIEIEI